MDVYNTARSHGLSPAKTASDASTSAGFGGVVCARASRSASRRRSNAVVAPYNAVSAARRATLRRTLVTRRSARSRSVAFPTANARRYRAANASACRHANCRSVSDAREGENENVDDDAAPSPSPDDATDHTASHVTWRVDSPIEPLLFHTAARRACAMAATASSATRSASRVSPRDSNKSKSRVATIARRMSSSCDVAANARWIPASARATNAASSASPRTVVLDVSVNESFVRRQRSVAASATTSAHAPRAADVGVDDNASANAARGSAFFGAGGEASASKSFPSSSSSSSPSSSSRLPRPSASCTASKTSAATPSSSVPSSRAAPAAFACARRSVAVFARRSNKSQDSYPNARLRKPACAVGDSSATAARNAETAEAERSAGESAAGDASSPSASSSPSPSARATVSFSSSSAPLAVASPSVRASSSATRVSASSVSSVSSVISVFSVFSASAAFAAFASFAFRAASACS